MTFGWRSWARTVLVTAGVTSAFWVLLGGWWYARLNPVQPPATAAPTPAAGTVPLPARPPGGVVRGARLIIPVAGVGPDQLVDTFDQARANGRRHDAIDIMAAEGTPVIAAAPGRVEKLFVSADGGNTVYVRSPDGATIYYYAHLLDYAPGLAEGARLGAGDPIGRVGHTGDADAAAPHLHFEVIVTQAAAKWYDKGLSVNPYPMLRGASQPG